MPLFTGTNSAITQVAAIGGQRTFTQYVIPTKPISEGASRVTGLTFYNNSLYHCGKPVEAISARDALSDFIDFVCSFRTKPILVGHNIKRYDYNVLSHNMKALGLWQKFHESCYGFVDTIEVSRRIHPGLPSYSQPELVGRFCGYTYNGHNALADTRALADLVNHMPADITPFIFN